MAGYLVYSDTDPTASFRRYSTMTDESIIDLEARYPGWLDMRLEAESRWLDARLRKRYYAPFADPVPATVRHWLAAIVSPAAYRKLGVDPMDQQMSEVIAERDTAKEEVAEAANAVDGLFDLPLRDDEDATAVTKGAPRHYSEASPFVGADVRRSIGREQDRNGRGT